jgi:ribosomal-protein-alanine N-acetyltransferase
VNAPELIETARLVLRRPRPNDADAIYARYAGDPAVTTFLGWPTHRSLEDTRAFVRFSDAEWERWSAGPYVITARGDERILGGTGLSVETPYRAATGYVLARDSWGQGIAAEALRAMVDVAERLGLARVHAFCHPEHAASRRVLEKCGFLVRARGDGTPSSRTACPRGRQMCSAMRSARWVRVPRPEPRVRPAAS